MYGELSSFLAAIEPPFWAGLIASFIRKHGYNVMVMDAEVEGWSHEYLAEMVAQHDPLLTAVIIQGHAPSVTSTPKMAATAEFLSVVKANSPHIKTILCGIHPSALPGMTLMEEKTDFVCQGEGFYTILELLARLSSGIEDYKIDGLWYKEKDRVVSNPRAKLLSSDELPPVAWDLLPVAKYRCHNWHALADLDKRSPYGVIYTSLGCPYYCHFCTIHALYKGNKPSIRFRPPEEVVDEIGLLVNKYGVRHIKIMDELFTLKEKHVHCICDLIIERGYDLNMWAYGRVEGVNMPMLKKMKQAGINWIGYGLEAGSPVVRGAVGKKFSQEAMKKAIEMPREVGMYHMPAFIFGLPDDNLETMQATLDMAKEYNFEYVNLYCAAAYPGCQLYDDALRQGIRLPDSWDGYGQLSYDFIPLPTKYLSAEEVLRFRDRAFKEYFSRPEYLDMIGRKFGDKAVEHIKEMLKHKLHRKLLEEEK